MIKGWAVTGTQAMGFPLVPEPLKASLVSN